MWDVVKPFCAARWWPAWVACVMIATAAKAEETKTLEWKFAKGDTKRYVLEQKIVSEQTEQGRSQKATMKQVFDVTWHVRSVDDQGVADVTNTVERVRVTIQPPAGVGQPVAYDSADTRNETPPFAEPLHALLKHPFSMKVDRQGLVSDVKIPEAVKAVPKAPGADAGDLEEQWKEMFKGMPEFPAEPLQRGSSWRRTAESKGPLGSKKATATYTYEGTEERGGRELDKIDVKVDLQFAAAGGEAGPKPKIVSHDSEGVIYFDAAQGWLVEQHSKETLEAEFTNGKTTVPETMVTTTDVRLVPNDREAE